MKMSEWFIVLLACIIVIGNTGIWPMPNLLMQHMVSQNLTAVPFSDPNAHYMFTNYFEPLVFWLLGGRSFSAYAIYVSIVSLAFLVLFVSWFVRYHGKEVALKEHKLFAAVTFPVFMIPFYWIGMDGMTLLLMLLVMITYKRLWVVLPAFFLGLQHFEQGFVAIAILMGSVVLHYIVRREQESLDLLKRLSLILLFIVIGKVLLTFWFSVMDVGLSGNRSSYMQNHVAMYLSMWKSSWYTILWSLLGIGWIFAIYFAKKLWPLFASVIVVFALTAVVGDQTRVGVILLFPSLFYWLIMQKNLWREMKQNLVYLMVLLYLLLPVMVVWGSTHGSLLSYDMKVFKQYQNNTLNVATFDWLLPFKQEESQLVSTPLKEYKAKIELIDKPLIVCKQNERCNINVKVTNISNEIWKAQTSNVGSYRVNLSYHIEDVDGKIILNDGIRTLLPHDISGGVTLPLTLYIKQNLQKGHYYIKADLVQESVAWFGEKNAENLLTIPLEVQQ